MVHTIGTISACIANQNQTTASFSGSSENVLPVHPVSTFLAFCVCGQKLCLKIGWLFTFRIRELGPEVSLVQGVIHRKQSLKKKQELWMMKRRTLTLSMFCCYMESKWKVCKTKVLRKTELKTKVFRQILY